MSLRSSVGGEVWQVTHRRKRRDVDQSISMTVLPSFLSKVSHGILWHVDVRMHVCLQHAFNILWLLLNEWLIKHDSSTVNDDADSLVGLSKELSVCAWSCFCHIELNYFCLNRWIQFLCFLSDLIEFVHWSGANLEIIACFCKFKCVSSTNAFWSTCHDSPFVLCTKLLI